MDCVAWAFNGPQHGSAAASGRSCCALFQNNAATGLAAPTRQSILVNSAQALEPCNRPTARRRLNVCAHGSKLACSWVQPSHGARLGGNHARSCPDGKRLAARYSRWSRRSLHAQTKTSARMARRSFQHDATAYRIRIYSQVRWLTLTPPYRFNDIDRLNSPQRATLDAHCHERLVAVHAVRFSLASVRRTLRSTRIKQFGDLIEACRAIGGDVRSVSESCA